MKKPGETAFVRILRDGKEHAFNVSLNFTVSHQLFSVTFVCYLFLYVTLSATNIICIYSSQEQQPLVPYKFLPSYYIVAGFVFVPLSKPYVDKSSDICECVLNMAAKKAGEQVVIISQVCVYFLF